MQRRVASGGSGRDEQSLRPLWPRGTQQCSLLGCRYVCHATFSTARDGSQFAYMPASKMRIPTAALRGLGRPEWLWDELITVVVALTRRIQLCSTWGRKAMQVLVQTCLRQGQPPMGAIAGRTYLS